MRKIFLVLTLVCSQVFCLVKAESLVQERAYIRLSKSEYHQLKRQAFVTRSILQRIRDLEDLYKNIKAIVEGINRVVKLVTEVLNIDNIDLPLINSGSGQENEHISGIILDPGLIEIEVKTSNIDQNFDDLGLDSLDFDLYYNKNLFQIDRIAGDAVLGEEYKILSVSSKTSGAKDRIKLPLSDLLSGELSFKVYFAPRNPELAELGDKSNLDIRYYKRVPKNEDGERIAPINFEFAENSAQEIEVKVK